MGQIDALRVQTGDGAYTFTQKDLALLIKELDQRINLAEVWETISKTSGLISKVEYFSDAAKTIKILERQFTYSGSKLASWITIIYNEGGTEDSRVTTTMSRTSGDIASSVDDFSTSEDTTDI